MTWTSLLFGLWHIFPTLDSFDGKPASIVQNPSRTRPMAAFGNAVVTAGAGLFFSYLRLRSRSVAAPVLTHAAINVEELVIARVLVERADSLAEGVTPSVNISSTLQRKIGVMSAKKRETRT
jgi:membrane protease YdiL (CAAX protease family)